MIGHTVKSSKKVSVIEFWEATTQPQWPLKNYFFFSEIKIFTFKCLIISIFQKPIKMYERWQQHECFRSLSLHIWAAESDNNCTIAAFLLIRKRKLTFGYGKQELGMQWVRVLEGKRAAFESKLNAGKSMSHWSSLHG